MALSSANLECHCMNPVGPFQTASPALTESGRSARAPLASAPSGQGAGTVASLHFQEALAQAHPTSPQTGRPVRVQAGETLIGITRRVLQEQGQTPKEAEVHRVAMAVAKSNALANPNLIRAGQTLSFPALALSRTAPNWRLLKNWSPPKNWPLLKNWPFQRNWRRQKPSANSAQSRPRSRRAPR